MYIIQVKQNPNVENYIDMAEEEEPAAAKQRMKQLVGEYQSEGRVIEIKAEAKMEYNDYFDKPSLKQNGPIVKIDAQKNEKEIMKSSDFPTKSEINEEAKKIKKEDLSDAQTNNIIWAKTPCKGEICTHFNNGECESFANINDPIINSEGECQGFDPKDENDSEELKDLEELSDDAKEIIDVIVDLAMLKQKTPTLSEVVEEGIKRHEVYKHFDGYKEACKIVGLEVNSGGRK